MGGGATVLGGAAVISMLGRNTGAEPPRHGDCARVEVTRCQGPNQGGEVYPAHWEVACKYLSEALVKLGMNE